MVRRPPGGWAALARHYRATEPFVGKFRHFRGGKVGWSNFSGCLTIGTNAHGLHIAPIVIFRVGHPPLFIPWSEMSEIDVHFKRVWIFSFFALHAAKVPNVWLQFSGTLGKQIAADANQSWATETPSVE